MKKSLRSEYRRISVFNDDSFAEWESTMYKDKNDSREEAVYFEIMRRSDIDFAIEKIFSVLQRQYSCTTHEFEVLPPRCARCGVTPDLAEAMSEAMEVMEKM